jgi:hypothetical protein
MYKFNLSVALSFVNVFSTSGNLSTLIPELAAAWGGGGLHSEGLIFLHDIVHGFWSGLFAAFEDSVSKGLFSYPFKGLVSLLTVCSPCVF